MSKKLTTGDKVMIGVAGAIVVLPVAAIVVGVGYVIKKVLDDRANQRASDIRAQESRDAVARIVSGADTRPGMINGLAGVIRKAVNVPQEIAMLPFDMLRTQLVNTRRPELLAAMQAGGQHIAAILPVTHGIPGTNPAGGLVAIATARSQLDALRVTAAGQAIRGSSSVAKARDVLVNKLPRTTDRIPDVMSGLRATEIPFLPRSELPADLQARVALLRTNPFSYR